MAFADAAEAYDHHVGRYGDQLAVELISVAGLEDGQRVLDVGCGPGPLTRSLAARVGEQNVAAIDPSEAFVEACRTRVPGVDVRIGVAEHIPFADDRFDAVFAQLVLQLLDDPGAGVTEMARVTRPGGVIAACVWDSTTMPLLRAFWDAALAVASERAGAIDDAQRVGYPSPDTLGELFERHGLQDVATGELWASASYADFDELFAPFTSGTGHSGACFAALEPARQASVRAGAYERLGAPRGTFTLRARAWWARGIA